MDARREYYESHPIETMVQVNEHGFAWQENVLYLYGIKV